jgi:hypothetical protein
VDVAPAVPSHVTTAPMAAAFKVSAPKAVAPIAAASVTAAPSAFPPVAAAPYLLLL